MKCQNFHILCLYSIHQFFNSKLNFASFLYPCFYMYSYTCVNPSRMRVFIVSSRDLLGNHISHVTAQKGNPVQYSPGFLFPELDNEMVLQIENCLYFFFLCNNTDWGNTKTDFFLFKTKEFKNKKIKNIQNKNLNLTINTGVPTKDETSETIVRK